MKIKKRSLKFFLYIVILFLLFPKKAHAYLDPGAGSYILQIIAAAFFTALFLFKSWWGRLKVFLSKIFFKKDNDSNDKTRIERE